MECWICGADADSGEHLVKASDVRSVFGVVSQKKPLFFHTEEKRNQLIKGVKVSSLKSSAKICAKCNNQRTQPHDRAWEKLSLYLRLREPPFRVGDRVRLHKVFPGSVRDSVLGVHLYFVKIFGCQIAEHEIPIDIELFSEALLNGKPHPNIYLAICPQIDKGLKSIGRSAITTEKLGDRIVFAVWFYILDKFTVRVMYAEPGERRHGLIDAWHPSSIRKCIRISASS